MWSIFSKRTYELHIGVWFAALLDMTLNSGFDSIVYIARQSCFICTLRYSVIITQIASKLSHRYCKPKIRMYCLSMTSHEIHRLYCQLERCCTPYIPHFTGENWNHHDVFVAHSALADLCPQQYSMPIHAHIVVICSDAINLSARDISYVAIVTRWRSDMVKWYQVRYHQVIQANRTAVYHYSKFQHNRIGLISA